MPAVFMAVDAAVEQVVDIGENECDEIYQSKNSITVHLAAVAGHKERGERR
jgi:hypothetical protein